MPEVELSSGTIDYEDTGGDGPVIVLVHGLMMDGSLWRHVIDGAALGLPLRSADAAARRPPSRRCAPTPTCRCGASRSCSASCSSVSSCARSRSR